MHKKVLHIFILLIFSFLASHAQDDDKYLHSKEGNTVGFKKDFIISCRQGFAAPAENKIITKICECQINLLERRFPLKQIRQYQKKYKGDAWNKLIEEDTILQRQFKDCFEGNNDALLLSIPAYRESFIKECVESITRENPERNLNDTLVSVYCNCAAEIIEKRKIKLDKMDELSDPNSFIYNEIAYKCGSPFLEASDFAKEWRASNRNDINGPFEIDSVQVISVNGMHKVKIAVGGIIKIWMIDSGASDLLMSDDFAKTLREKGVISERNFAGEGHYMLADNRQVTCKRYKIDNVQIGRYSVNNIIIAVSKDVKEFLVGKSLLNKFSQWTIDNKNNVLILKK
jgi:hypothetical protein